MKRMLDPVSHACLNSPLTELRPELKGGAVSYFKPERGSDNLADGTTGRYLVLFAEDATKAGVKALGEATGVRVATATAEGKELEGEGAVLFDKLGVAVVSAPPEQIEEA